MGGDETVSKSVRGAPWRGDAKNVHTVGLSIQNGGQGRAELCRAGQGRGVFKSAILILRHTEVSIYPSIHPSIKPNIDIHTPTHQPTNPVTQGP